MTDKERDALRKYVETVVRVEVAKASAALTDRIERAQASGVRYRGVWRSGSEYERGEMATLKGALWHCNEPTKDRPGTNHHWTLMHKSDG